MNIVNETVSNISNGTYTVNNLTGNVYRRLITGVNASVIEAMGTSNSEQTYNNNIASIRARVSAIFTAIANGNNHNSN